MIVASYVILPPSVRVQTYLFEPLGRRREIPRYSPLVDGGASLYTKNNQLYTNCYLQEKLYINNLLLTTFQQLGASHWVCTKRI